MQTNFDQSLKYVLLDEGGNSDDPNDPGGRTSRGITQGTYDSWCKLNNQPPGDVWNATDDAVKSIYHDQYWNPYCDSLPGGVDYLYFDISVNSGRTQATRLFQKALGVTVDGMLGQITMSRIQSVDPIKLINAVSERRRDFYRSLSQFSRYGKGWMNRTNHSENAAIAMSKATDFEKPAAISVKATDPVTPAVPPEVTGTATGGLLAVL
ncbi:MAG: glycoside hydrolase family 108 protein, partial [Candidatus Saccharimonadales bacterium]